MKTDVAASAALRHRKLTFCQEPCSGSISARREATSCHPKDNATSCPQAPQEGRLALPEVKCYNTGCSTEEQVPTALRFPALHLRASEEAARIPARPLSAILAHANKSFAACQHWQSLQKVLSSIQSHGELILTQPLHTLSGSGLRKDRECSAGSP